MARTCFLYLSVCAASSTRGGVTVSNVYVVNPTSAVVVVNANYNDVAKLSNIKIASTKSTVKVCVRTKAVPKGQESPILGDDADGKVCVYDPASIQVITKSA